MNREQKIYRIMGTLRGAQLTRQELSEVTGIPLESVCGRVNELMHRRSVEVCGHKVHPETKKAREILRARKDRAA